MKSSRGLIAAAVVAALLMTAVAALLAAQPPADASVFSRGSGGWRAAYRYLEAKGSRLALLDREPETAAPGVLVVAFPWQSFALDDPEQWINRHLRRGGTLVFAYAGRSFDGSESAVAKALDLAWQERERAPLNPFRWRKYAAEERSLFPEPSRAAGLRPGRIAAPRRVPRAPNGAAVLVRDERGRPLGFAYARGRGRVVAVPADAFSNARVGQPGNADLLETLRQELGPDWSFDEFHHGLRAPPTPGQSGPQRVLLLYLLQLAFVYVLVVLAVARRFGPAWSEPAPVSGSAASFLMGLGMLHHRLGHHREAARLLVARARELDGRLALPDAPADEGADLLDLARRVGRAQSGRGKSA
jgi:hypothetical protein